MLKDEAEREFVQRVRQRLTPVYLKEMVPQATIDGLLLYSEPLQPLIDYDRCFYVLMSAIDGQTMHVFLRTTLCESSDTDVTWTLEENQLKIRMRRLGDNWHDCHIL
jgi:hypothetical protein